MLLGAGSPTGFVLLFFGMFCFFAGCQRETEDGQAGTWGGTETGGNELTSITHLSFLIRERCVSNNLLSINTERECT